MSADNDRIRRELGLDLAQAGREAGVDTPIRRRSDTRRSMDRAGQASLYFTSFEQFEAWYRANDKER